MGLVYHNGRFIPEEHVQKSTEEAMVLRLLRSYLDEKEPGLVRILVNTWRSQGKAITYKELRGAILRGEITQEWLEDWMKDYAKLVKDHLQPAWEKAIETALEHKSLLYPANFDPMADALRSWVTSHSAEFVTNVSTAQIEGLRAVIKRAAVLEDMTVDELSRAIRPMIGLTKPQAMANLKYYETLRANGVTPKRAQERAIRYSARQHRNRAYDVARTELATAYNTGAHEGTKQAQALGLLGDTKKVWSTADDERVCPICGRLDGAEVGMEDEFPGISSSWSTRLHPPAHPGCRCCVMYVEIAPPKYQNNKNAQSKNQNLVV